MNENLESTNENKIESTNENKIDPTTVYYCGFCKRVLTDSEIHKVDNEYLCRLCGFVLREDISYVNDPETPLISALSSDLNIGNWKDESSASHTYDLGLATTIDSNFKDYTGRSFVTKSNLTLKKTSLRAKTNTSVERNIFRGHMEAIRLGKTLNIPVHVIKDVIKTYNEFSKAGYLKNKNVNSCVICLLVLFCDKHSIPLPIIEVLKETSVSRKKFNKDYFNIYYLFERAIPTGAKADAYLYKLVSAVSSDWPLLIQFKLILEKLKKEGVFLYMEGRDAIVTTGTVVYMVLKHLKYPHLDTYLKDLIINRLTIRNKWHCLIKKWPILADYGSFETLLKAPFKK